MRSLLALATILLFGLVWGQMTPRTASNELPFRVVEYGSNSSLKKTGVFVLKNERQFREFLKKVQGPAADHNKIEWSQHQLVAFQLSGSDPSSLSAKVERVVETEKGKANIEIVLDRRNNTELATTPLPGNVAKNVQYAYTIIEVPRNNDGYNVKIVSDDQ